MPKVKGTFEFIKFGTKMSDKQDKLREAFKTLEAAIKTELAEGREKSEALNEIESAYIWASRAIRTEQISRNAAKASR